MEAGVGDRLAPVPAREYTNYAPHPPAAPISGQIVSIYGDALTAGQNQIVVAQPRPDRRHRARPRAGALSPGQGRGRPDRDRQRIRTRIKLPDERHGVLFVFRVFERMSYALILSVQGAGLARRPVLAALIAAAPPRLARPPPGPRTAATLAMIDRDELAAWLRLVATPGVGRDAARRLLGEFGSPEGVLDASTAARRPLVGEAAAAALATEPPDFAALLAATLAWLDGRPADAAGGRDVLVLGDPRYPGSAARDRGPADAAVRRGPDRAARRRLDRHRRQPQPDRAGRWRTPAPSPAT